MLFHKKIQKKSNLVVSVLTILNYCRLTYTLVLELQPLNYEKLSSFQVVCGDWIF